MVHKHRVRIAASDDNAPVYKWITAHSMLREYLEPIGAGERFIIGGNEPITEMTFKRTFQRIAKTIDLHGATPHVFRHSFLTYAQTVVTDIKTLQAIAGHADIQTTMNR